MKRFEIMIATDRGEKKVSVCVSNEVALMLQACPNETSRFSIFNSKIILAFANLTL